MANTKNKPNRIAIFALIDRAQNDELIRLQSETERSKGFLVREAIAQYLANLKKKP